MEDFNSWDFDCDNYIIQNIYFFFYDNTALLSDTTCETIHVVNGYLAANPVKKTSLINKKATM